MRILGLLALALIGCRTDKLPPDSKVSVGDSDAPADIDGDGVTADEDCDDEDPAVYPGAPELCNGLDDDCDGEADEDATDATTWYEDADGDGYGDSRVAAQACDAPEGYVAAGEDCDDGDAAYHPGAAEEDCADPNDYNCDGSVGYADNDGDGYPACEECDDGARGVNPSATEVCNGVDDDCDGEVDADAVDRRTWYQDADGDGYGSADVSAESCEAPSGFVDNASDCDDGDAEVHPGATELCNELDDDCDGDVDVDAADAVTWYADDDGDGYGDPASSQLACDAPAEHVDNADDCDDLEPLAWTGAAEVCDEVDNDCDGDTDEDALTTWYLDYDQDGYGDDSSATEACEAPTSRYISSGGDCDDGEPLAWTGATESCDEVDNDCDGSTDEGVLTDYYADLDGDGYGDDGDSAQACSAPSGYSATGGDCDDDASDVYPGAATVCDDIDHDCDGSVDDDADGDGYSDAACGGTDCDDADASVVPEQGGGCALGTTCLDLLNAGYSADGVYTIDSDGYGTGLDPHDVYCDMTTDGGGWTRVYYQDTSTGDFFAQGQSEANRGSPEGVTRYAILDDLEDYRRGGELEFLMRWPNHSSFTLDQQWAQTSNPVTDSNGATPTGYRAISVPYTSQGWSDGLQRSYYPQYSLLDGTLSPLGNWYYAVGTTYCWGNQTTGCQPAPTGGAHEVELLVR
ncbi:MAG: hypothetical protein H6741_23035 [Alphaproteobacteria bacterium]|nr:hypothetical protein [Alphaproteobacteria bacterium]